MDWSADDQVRFYAALRVGDHALDALCSLSRSTHLDDRQRLTAAIRAYVLDRTQGRNALYGLALDPDVGWEIRLRAALVFKDSADSVQLLLKIAEAARSGVTRQIQAIAASIVSLIANGMKSVVRAENPVHAG